MLKRVVITGCTGMLGLGLIQILLANNIEILGIAHPASAKLSRLPKDERLKVVECDISDLFTLSEKITEQYDMFYHLAWSGTFGESRNDMYQQLKNIQYTIDAVRLAKNLGCHTFIGAGSQAEYGRSSVNINENTNTLPETGYGIAKLSAGFMSRIECEKLGLRHIWSRIFSVYGPNDNSYTMIISSIRKMLNGERPVFTKGEQIWDYLYCEDAAEALYLMGLKGRNNATYCLGSGNAIPLLNYINLIRDNIDRKLEIGFGDIPYSKNQIMYLCADITSLTKDTGFIPKTNFIEGIKKTIDWCKRGI